ncbi:zonular occludens toxin domain-containing protein [Comamonas sp. NoAH]|uniref:zonular occludens toxin domain-containing protein n=1 Tax=Comamonas halotolerans TaxID=3041496 RepID=UPI0024E09715|nr:zonular occludens toxin domain-containing protein [Comamonas sp. NoAH]
MPINTYTGLMGSGKSYECVSSVIVPAVRAGRRVVTNVDGIDSDAIRAYCQDKFSVPLEQLGKVVHCTNDDVPKASFLPHGKDVETFCLPGDIICIDEAWRFWGTDCKLLPEHKVFFREHRHFVHPETKVCCDLVLMVQDITDLHRTLRVVVEVTFRTTKIKTLGWQKTYRVEMWEGYKLTAKGRVSVQNKRYDVEIFPLYSSYSGGTGKELQVDSRQNVLRNPKLWIMVLVVIALFGWSLHTILGFFNGTRTQLNSNGEVDKIVSAPVQIHSSSVGQSISAQSERNHVSNIWRLAGTFQAQGKHFVVVENQEKRIRLEHPSAFLNAGAVMVGEVDGQRVTHWSGSQPSARGKP